LKDHGSIRLAANPMFGQEPQLSTASIDKILQDSGMTLQKLKEDILKMQEINNNLEKELYKSRESSPVTVETLGIIEEDNYF